MKHCYIVSVMAEMRYASVDYAAGYWGKLVWGSYWNLRIDIRDSNYNSWRVE